MKKKHSSNFPVRKGNNVSFESFIVKFASYFIGRQLCAELLLGLSLQRGSLRHLLQWVHMAIEAAALEDLQSDISRFED